MVLITFTACDDFVDVDPIGVEAEDYFNSEEEYESALIGAYDLLQATFQNVLISVVASDDFIAGGDPFNYDQPTLQNINSMIHTPSDNNQLREVWQLMYAGINRANYVLEFKDKTEFAGKAAVIAQAYFLRAYFTFELTKFFGDVPLTFEERGGVNRMTDKRILFGEEFDVNRVGSIADVYSLIEEDLKEAITSLPATQSQKYKITKGAAQALLGKVYLYHGTFDNSKFAQAATTLVHVYGKYSLKQGADYTNLFESEGENGDESVFEIQYSGVEAASWGCIICSEGSYFVQYNGPRSPYDNPVYRSGWGFNLPTQQLYDLFDANDNRREVTFLDLRNDQDTYSQGRDDTGFFNRKYLPRKADAKIGADPLNHANNYRAIRYADVLLMLAEAEVQSGGSNAAAYLNEVRARAFGNNSQNYTTAEGSLLEAIYTERRKELAGEGHRFFDLVRTGKAKANFDAFNASKPAEFNAVNFTENKHEIFPIPLVELQLANAVEKWGQNPGY
ncbi:RagB/SusD family nutrient uptake outer membrane protein [Polaribacter filamentus]|nr:RagB/SusD family nutrient uptake outer membrane protein [Polaribacter filamentus]